MRKVYGVPKLAAYLLEEGYPLSEEQIIGLMKEKAIPHSKPYQNIIAFNLDHIDWWVSQRR
ncbi:hypothetical protein ACFOZY_01405 [Chungangia koreensis]|uniref:Uncharacterized protein n=1 Tax=Chungangia koreensis TaxID=752657 RepID=A0ABV8X4U3_9LACT